MFAQNLPHPSALAHCVVQSDRCNTLEHCAELDSLETSPLWHGETAKHSSWLQSLLKLLLTLLTLMQFNQKLSSMLKSEKNSCREKGSIIIPLILLCLVSSDENNLKDREVWVWRRRQVLLKHRPGYIPRLQPSFSPSTSNPPLSSLNFCGYITCLSQQRVNG